MKKYQILALAASCLLVVGCSSMHGVVGSQSDNYLAAQAGTRLTVPEGLTHAQLRDYFILPHLNNQNQTGQPSLLPPGSGLAEHVAQADTGLERQHMRITRDAQGQSTMLIRTRLAQAWPAVDVGLQRAGYKVSVADEKLHTFYVLDTVADKSVSRDTHIYKVVLTPTESKRGTDVTVYDEQGVVLAPNKATKVLALLRRGITQNPVRA